MEEGRFAGSGRFKVDRRRALELLRDYQAPDAGLCAALWLRWALASGAEEVRLEGGARGFELRLRGGSPDPAALEDPWGPVFGGERADGRRDLALGLLAALRAAPRSLSLTLGSGGERRTLAMSALGSERLEPAPGGEEAVLAADWGGVEPDWRAPLLAEGACALAPCPVLADGAPLERLSAPADALAFTLGDARGWLRPRLGLESRSARLWVFRHGVRAQDRPAEPGLPVAGLVEDPRLALDASLTRVAPDARWSKLGRALDRLARELVRTVLAAHAPAFRAAAGKLGGRRGLELWSARSGWRSSLDAPDGWEGVERELRRAEGAEGAALVRAGLLADWLHDCRAALAAEPGSLLEALDRAPLLLAAKGGTLSLAEAAAARDRLGSVPYLRRPDAAASPETVWCPSALELGWLKLRFGEGVREAH